MSTLLVRRVRIPLVLIVAALVVCAAAACAPALAASAAAPVTFTITPLVDGGHGSVTPATPQHVAAGATPTFTFAPDAGYGVAQVLVDGVPVDPTTATSYTFAPVAADHAFTVSFGLLAGALTTRAPSPATVKRGRVAVLEYEADQAVLRGRATVTIRISDASGRVVKTLTRRHVSLNVLHKARFLCLLPKGVYTFTVTARTSAGAESMGDGSNTLTVR
jgi:hypothetical protein